MIGDGSDFLLVNCCYLVILLCIVLYSNRWLAKKMVLKSPQKLVVKKHKCSPKKSQEFSTMVQTHSRWWFQTFFIFTPIWGRFPFWLIFFRWVETTNQHWLTLGKTSRFERKEENNWLKSALREGDGAAWRIIPGLGYMVSNHGEYISPLRIGLWDPLQMAELHGL